MWLQLPSRRVWRFSSSGSARILRAGEGILPSRNFKQLSRSIDAVADGAHSSRSSSPQNAATSTLQACAPQISRANELLLASGARLSDQNFMYSNTRFFKNLTVVLVGFVLAAYRLIAADDLVEIKSEITKRHNEAVKR